MLDIKELSKAVRQVAEEKGLAPETIIEAIESSIAAAYKSEWPLLIVCPSSMRFAWKTAILKWMPDFQDHEIHVITGGWKSFLKHGPTLASFFLISSFYSD